MKKPSISLAYKSVTDEVKRLSDQEQAAVSDIFEGSTNGRAAGYANGCWGHKKSYWKRQGALPHEAFAEMYAATMTQGMSLGSLQRYFPKSYAMFEDMVTEMGKI